MLNFVSMKIKNSANLTALVTLVATLVVTTTIDIIVWTATKKNKPNDDSSVKLYANEHDGNKIYEDLLLFAKDMVKLNYENASVDELISIGFKEDKLYFSCLASDEQSKIALISLDSSSNDIDSTLKYIANTPNLKSSTFLMSATYYTQEDLSTSQEESLKVKYNLGSTNRVAYAKDMTPNKKDNLFVTYLENGTYTSVSNATFDSEGNVDDTNALKVSATRHENSYLYWLLFKLCA